MLPGTTMTRRGLLGLGAAAVGAAVLPGTGIARAQPLIDQSLIDPYSGAIPLVFPVDEGTYQVPVADNWHTQREGQRYPWNHLSGAGHRAHDGVDIYPVPGAAPPVYAPLDGTIAAVCLRSTNTPDAVVSYQASQHTPPPWDYSQAVDDIAGVALYGNFVWLFSTDEHSAGYFVFCCHLQQETTIRSLAPDQSITTQTQIGVLGDTGNAVGVPQLHVEIHYPSGSSYTCQQCTPPTALTSIDPAASLQQATRR